MNILLLNLTRFGDILQTQAAVTDMVSAGHTVGVACLENFSGAVSLLDGPAHAFPFPSSVLLAGVAGHDSKGQRWVGALAQLHAWRDALERVMQPEVVVNFTPTLTARLLSSFLAGEGRVAGFGLDREGFGRYSNPWAALLSGVSAGRGLSPFNIVDIFRKVSEPFGTLRPGSRAADLVRPDEEKIKAAHVRLMKKAPDGSRGFVAFQLGASEERRRWPVDLFVETGQLLWDSMRLCPVLLGSAQERELAVRYGKTAHHPHVSLAGETTLEALASTLCCCRLLVTNDTGTMHLAAGLSIPVVALFLATAQPFDTGPYREGSCCLEPDIPCHPCAFGTVCDLEHACRWSIKPYDVAALVKNRLERGTWTQGAVGFSQRLRVWETVLDNHGLMTLVSLSGHEKEDRATWIAWQHSFLRQFLDRRQAVKHAFVHEEGLPVLSAELRAKLYEESHNIAVLLELLEQQGTLLTMKALPPLREKFLATWSRVHQAFVVSPLFGALGLLWLEETQSQGRNMKEVLQSIRLYRGLMDVLADCSRQSI